MAVTSAVKDTPLATAETTVRSGTDDVPPYTARRVTTGLRPGVIVIHEAFGLNDHIRDVARQFAAAGLDAIGPHLCSRKVGVIGFCSGGRQSLLFACSSEAADAAVDCSGGFIDRASPDADVTPEQPVAVLDLVDRPSCTLFVIGGAEDQNSSPQVIDRFRQRLDVAGKEAEVVVFDGAGHAFSPELPPLVRPRRRLRPVDAGPGFLPQATGLSAWT
jgi:carboxymethylenebutenolidase